MKYTLDNVYEDYNQSGELILVDADGNPVPDNIAARLLEQHERNMADLCHGRGPYWDGAVAVGDALMNEIAAATVAHDARYDGYGIPPKKGRQSRKFLDGYFAAGGSEQTAVDTLKHAISAGRPKQFKTWEQFGKAVAAGKYVIGV